MCAGKSSAPMCAGEGTGCLKQYNAVHVWEPNPNTTQRADHALLMGFDDVCAAALCGNCMYDCKSSALMCAARVPRQLVVGAVQCCCILLTRSSAAAAAAAAGRQMNNPWHLWQLWRSDVRLQRSCLAKHNAIMDLKMDRVMAQPPPDYTIAGAAGLLLWLPIGCHATWAITTSRCYRCCCCSLAGCSAPAVGASQWSTAVPQPAQDGGGGLFLRVHALRVYVCGASPLVQ
jgi:hypothetical protein